VESAHYYSSNVIASNLNPVKLQPMIVKIRKLKHSK